MFALPLLAGASAAPVAIKFLGELHRTTLQANTLARQGEGVPSLKGAGERAARQRASGINAPTRSKKPAWMDKVPTRATVGDLRRDYEVEGPGNATSSQGMLDDILSKVPRKVQGTEQYQKIARPQPSREPGFGNQSFTP